MFSAEVLDLQTLSQSKLFQGLCSIWAQIKESESVASRVNYCGARVPNHFLGIFQCRKLEHSSCMMRYCTYVPYYNAVRWPKIKNNSSILSECTFPRVTGLKSVQDKPNWFLINHINHLAILSHFFLLHEVLILGPLGYEPKRFLCTTEQMLEF